MADWRFALIDRKILDELRVREPAVDWLKRRYGDRVCEVIAPASGYKEELMTWFREELLERCRRVASEYPDIYDQVYLRCKAIAKRVAEVDKDEADDLRSECIRGAIEITPAEIREATLAEVQAKLAPFEDIDKYIEEKYGTDPCWLISTHPPGWVGNVYNRWKKDVVETCKAIGKIYGREAYNECIDRASDMADTAKSRLKELYDMCRPRRRTLAARILGW